MNYSDLLVGNKYKSRNTGSIFVILFFDDISVYSAKQEDSFDNSKTMAKIAEQMIIQRGDNETNFDGLGKTKEVHKNSEETDRTIDLLSGLD